MSSEIFISYRRGDAEVAEALAARLETDWGFGDRIWRDETHLQQGAPWSAGLAQALDRAELVVAVIGPAWLEPDNVLRLLDAADFVRRELGETLAAGKPVIPVLVDGLPVPLASQLPSELRGMLDLECVRISSALTNRDRRTVVGALTRQGQRPTGAVVPWVFDRASLAPRRVVDGLRHHLAGWAAGEGCRVRAVVGPPGTGRTAVLERLRDDPPPSCLTALHLVRDAESSPVPYRTAVHWFRDVVDGIAALDDRHRRERAARALAGALTRSGADLVAADGLIDRAQLVQAGVDLDDLVAFGWGNRTADFPPGRIRRQIVSVLAEISAAIPLLLLVDDLHRLDDGSRDLVLDLQRRLRSDAATGWRMALVVTGPPPATDDDDTLAPLADLAVDDGLEQPFGLSFLTGGDEPGRAVLDVVTQQGHVKLAPELAEWLVGTGYTPFLAVTALRRLDDAGLLRCDADGGWCLDGGVDPAAGADGDADAVAARADDAALFSYLLRSEVPDALLPTIEIGAVLGLTFSFDLAVDVLAQLHRGERPDAEALWQELRSNDLDCMVYRCFSSPDRAISFAHSSFPASLLAGMRPARLQILRTAIIEVLEARLAADGDRDLAQQLADTASLAEHLGGAGRRQEAAAQHVRAADLATRALAERQAIGHLEQAHRHELALLARADGGPSTPELLLRMAACDARKARLLRLGGRDGSVNLAHAEEHLDQALEHLRGVAESVELAPGPAATIRDALTGAEAEVDRDETYRRLVHAQRGENALERGRAQRDRGELAGAEVELLAALRHAEDAPPLPARSRLIAEASAHMALTLADKVRAERPRWSRATAHAVARDAMFHVARVLALSPRTTADGSAHPGGTRAAQQAAAITALRAQGRLHHTVHRDPLLAARCYRRALDLVPAGGGGPDLDVRRDRGLVALAVADAAGDDRALAAARVDLDRYRRWAAEVGSHRHELLADLALALAACVDGAADAPALPASARAVADAPGLTAGERRRVRLVAGLLATVRRGTAGDGDGVAGSDGAGDADGDGGWFAPEGSTAEGLRQALWEVADELPRRAGAWASALLGDEALVAWTAGFAADLVANRAQYVGTDLDAEQLVRRLSVAFLDEAGRDHAARVAAVVTRIVESHAHPDEVALLGRDARLAAHLHDWMRALPGPRMLALARDWHLDVNGVEWADPQLLHGPLAAELLDRQLGGSDLLGQAHFARVRAMVAHHTVGDAVTPEGIGFAEAAFFLADCQAAHERRTGSTPDWADLACRPDGWREALAVVRAGKVRELVTAGVTVHPRSWPETVTERAVEPA